MEFIELDSKAFDEVCIKFDGNSFYQTSAWALIKNNTGWNYNYVGVKNNDEIVACSLILGRKIYFNHYLYYAPRGVLCDYNDYEVLNFFIDNIKIFLKKKNGILFKIDPLIEYKHHDINGNYINDGFSNQSIIDNLKKLGFKHHGFTIGYSEEAQFRWSYCLNIDKDYDELLQGMNQRCRRCIRKSSKYPIDIREVNDDNINDFKSIMQDTANRQNHFDRDISYYKLLDSKFNRDSKLVIAYLNREKYLNDFKEDKLYNLINDDNREYIPISAGVFIRDNSRINYVYGGTYKKYMPLMAQYMIQMKMIRWGKDTNISIYDFGGISGNFDINSNNYGVYDFKRGFGGKVIEYIGEFDLVLNFVGYNIYDKGYDLYRHLKHLAAKIIKK